MRLTSLLKPLQRDPGWAGEVQGVVLGRTAAASLGFGSWEAGTAVKVGAGGGCKTWGQSQGCVCGRGTETGGMGMMRGGMQEVNFSAHGLWSDIGMLG